MVVGSINTTQHITYRGGPVFINMKGVRFRSSRKARVDWTSSHGGAGGYIWIKGKSFSKSEISIRYYVVGSMKRKRLLYGRHQCKPAISMAGL